MSQTQQVLYILLSVLFDVQIICFPKGMQNKGLFSGTSHLNYILHGKIDVCANKYENNSIMEIALILFIHNKETRGLGKFICCVIYR